MSEATRSKGRDVTGDGGRRVAASPTRFSAVAAATCIGFGALTGGVVVKAFDRRDGGSEEVRADGGSASSTPATTATSTTLATTTPPVVTSTSTSTSASPRSAKHDWDAVAATLAPQLRLPSDCPLPLDEPESLPNADRAYRGGVHEGIDFICGERGRNAVAAMAGRVVMANNSFEDPDPTDREAVLAIAKQLGYTPPWTLAMLFGRFVVIDHGDIEGAGHVVTIYAHLDSIDPGLRVGKKIPAGTRLGEIGNRGTETGATRGARARSIHLHWELHVDDDFLGEDLDAAGTRRVYAELFGKS